MLISVGLGSQLGLSHDELTLLAGPAAELGFHRMWTHLRTVPDAFHVCESWWSESAREGRGGIGVGVGVLPAPQWWQPAALAVQAATTATLTGGRFTLGLGTGGYGPQFWADLHLPDRPISIMRDYVRALRAAFRGGPVNYCGATVSLRNFALEQAPPPVPIYLGALGPQMIRLGGECADGVLLNWASPPLIAESAQRLAGGATAAGRRRSDVSLAMYLRCAVDDDVDAARRVVASELLRKLAPQQQQRRQSRPGLGYNGQFARLGFGQEIARLERRFADGAVAGDLLDEVPAELCGAAGYFGNAQDAPARVAELAQGLDEVIIWIVPARPGTEAVRDTMRALAPEKILSAAARR